MELLKNTNFDFISKHRTGFVFSAVIIAIGLIFLVIQCCAWRYVWRVAAA